MEPVHLDLAVRIGASTNILLLAWLLLRCRREVGLPAALFAPLAVCVSAFVIGNTPASALRPSGVLGAVAHMASGYTVVFLWWFCLSCFDGRFRPRGGVLAVGLTWAVIAALDRGLLGGMLADTGLSRLLVVMGFGIVGHLVWQLIAERAGDLIQQRHDARIMVAVLLGGMLFVDLAADALLGFTWRPLAFAMAQNVAILGFSLWLAGKLLAVRADAFALGATTGEAPTTNTRQEPAAARDDELRRRLDILMGMERMFLDPDLTLATFSRRVGASEKTVRKLINRELGFDHFRTFLNHYRVAEARRLLADPLRADDKLITIAFDSGFASLASFNRVFQAMEGRSPSQYRTAALGSVDDASPAVLGVAAGF